MHFTGFDLLFMFARIAYSRWSSLPNAIRVAAFLVVACIPAFAQEEASPESLKKLTIEELMNIEVTSVSRRPEKLLETPSAIQVISSDDINSFGATNIPEALYLAGNLQVVQKNSHAWGITARGFNTDLANKMLVLMDGRTVYTPLFSGVYWDRQDYLLNDLNRIEVISGPGGTLWGANAVNGVINIITKTAEETQGLYAEASAGNELRAQGSLRYGGQLGSNAFYRVYGKYSDRDSMVFPDSIDANDAWRIAQGGFRIDVAPASPSKFTLQGDIYGNKGGLITGRTSILNGGNILGRWVRNFSDSSETRLQMYVDRTYLSAPTPAFVVGALTLAPEGVFEDNLTTYDLDFQHTLRLGKVNHFVWGLGYRYTHDEVVNSPGLGFFPEKLNQSLYSLFVQDEISILRNLSLTVGTKLEHNAFTGFVLEPNGRLGWSIDNKNFFWGAVSRAVRTPSRIDRQLSQGTPPNFVLLRGSEDFISETVVSTEVGYRAAIANRVTASLSFYFNQYDQLRSTVLDPVTIFPLYFANGLEGEVLGAELSVVYQVAAWWRLFTSFNLLEEDIRVKDGQTDFNNALNETADPGRQFSLRSSFDLPRGIGINGAFRWVDDFTINNAGEANTVPSYAELDGQIDWSINKHFNVAIAGRNLLNNYHIEYGNESPSRVAIQRSVYFKVRFVF